MRRAWRGARAPPEKRRRGGGPLSVGQRRGGRSGGRAAALPSLATPASACRLPAYASSRVSHSPAHAGYRPARVERAGGRPGRPRTRPEGASEPPGGGGGPPTCGWGPRLASPHCWPGPHLPPSPLQAGRPGLTWRVWGGRVWGVEGAAGRRMVGAKKKKKGMSAPGSCSPPFTPRLFRAARPSAPPLSSPRASPPPPKPCPPRPQCRPPRPHRRPATSCCPTSGACWCRSRRRCRRGR